MPQKDVHRSLELLEEYHAELFRSSDQELKQSLERVIGVFKSSLFNALCDIHEFYENVLLNRKLMPDQKVAEARRFATRWEAQQQRQRQQRTAAATASTRIAPLQNGQVRPETFSTPPPPPRSSSASSLKRPIPLVDPDAFLQTSPVNRLVDALGREWEVEEVLLDVSRTGLGFSIAGGRNRQVEPKFRDLGQHVYVMDIAPGGAVALDGRIRVGDVLLRVNDFDCALVDHEQAVEALQRTSNFVRLLVKRPKPLSTQRSLSQTHISAAQNGVAEQVGYMHSHSRSRSLHQLPSPQPPLQSFPTTTPLITKAGTLPSRQKPAQSVPIQVQFRRPVPPAVGTIRMVTLRKGDGMGFNIVGGEDGEPIYVSHLNPGGPADLSGGVFKGDILLRVGDVDLSIATHSEAAITLKSIPRDTLVTLTLQYRPREFQLFEAKVERHLAEQQQQQRQRAYSSGGYR